MPTVTKHLAYQGSSLLSNIRTLPTLFTKLNRKVFYILNLGTGKAISEVEHRAEVIQDDVKEAAHGRENLIEVLNDGEVAVSMKA